MTAFVFLEGHCVRGWGQVGVGKFEGDIAGENALALADDDRALDRVFQFSDIAGPGVGRERGAGLGAQSGDRFVEMGSHALHEKSGQLRNVLAALAQRRQLQRKDLQAEVEVLAEGTVGDHLLEVAVGGGDNADIGAERLGAADSLEGLFLQ